MSQYVIFDLNGMVAFFDPATNKSDAVQQYVKDVGGEFTAEDVDLGRVHELDNHETSLMAQWIEDGQKTHTWPFDWKSKDVR